MKYREFIKKLLGNGAILVRHGKKHAIYKLKDGRRCCINVHSGEVSKGYEKFLK